MLCLCPGQVLAQTTLWDQKTSCFCFKHLLVSSQKCLKMSPAVLKNIPRCDLNCSQLLSLVGCNNTTTIPSTSQCENWFMSIFWSVNVIRHVRYRCQTWMYLWFTETSHANMMTGLQQRTICCSTSAEPSG